MRKMPQQARSRRLVERIVAAGRSVLVADGYEAFSTNRIAAAAGISPGSLYQYFADKTAILDVIVDRYWDDVSERVVASLSDRVGQFGPEMARATADALITALESDAALLRVIYEELPPGRFKEKRAALVRRVHQLGTAVLAAQPGTDTQRTAAVRAWVIVTAAENLAARWVLDKPAVTRTELVDELAALVMGYVVNPHSPARREAAGAGTLAGAAAAGPATARRRRGAEGRS